MIPSVQADCSMGDPGNTAEIKTLAGTIKTRIEVCIFRCLWHSLPWLFSTESCVHLQFSVLISGFQGHWWQWYSRQGSLPSARRSGQEDGQLARAPLRVSRSLAVGGSWSSPATSRQRTASLCDAARGGQGSRTRADVSTVPRCDHTVVAHDQAACLGSGVRFSPTRPIAFTDF